MNSDSPKAMYKIVAPAILGVLCLVGCSQNASTSEQSAPISPSVAQSVAQSEISPVQSQSTRAQATAVTQESTEHTQKYHAIIQDIKEQLSDAIKARDVDMAFIKSMIAHHQAAVSMAYVELKHGKNPQVREMAQAVIDTQQAEIGWMKDWLIAQPKQKDISDDLSDVQQQIAKIDKQAFDHMIDDSNDPDADTAFVKVMIGHHKLAVNMAKIYQKQSLASEIDDFANQMMMEQQHHIDTMKAWLKSDKKR